MFNSVTSWFSRSAPKRDRSDIRSQGANIRVPRKVAGERLSPLQRLAAFLRRTFTAAPTAEQIRCQLNAELQRPYSELDVRQLIALETRLVQRAPRRRPAPAFEAAQALADKSVPQLRDLVQQLQQQPARRAHPLRDAIQATLQQREMEAAAVAHVLDAPEVIVASPAVEASVAIAAVPSVLASVAQKDMASQALRRGKMPKAPEAPLPLTAAQKARPDLPIAAEKSASASAPVAPMVGVAVAVAAPAETVAPATLPAPPEPDPANQLLQQLLELRTELFHHIYLGNISGLAPVRFNRNLQVLQQAISAIQRQYSESRAVDEATGENTVLMELRDQAELTAKHQIIQQSRSLDASALAALSPAELDRVLNECIEERRLRNSVQVKFTQLLNSCGHDYYRGQRIEVSAGGATHSRVDCHGSHLLGYSVFMLLRTLMPQSRGEAAYDGETSFELSQAELQTLQRYLDARTAQVEQFSSNLARLLAEDGAAAEDTDMNSYIQLGQKPVSEAIVSTTALTARGIEQMSGEAEGVPVLLFSALSLNLSAYPDDEARATIRSELTAMFVALGLRSQNKELKQFIRSDPYRANFSVQQLELLQDAMHQLAAVKDYVNAFLRKVGSTANFWQPQQWLELFGGQMSTVMTEFELERLTPIIELLVPDARHLLRDEIAGRMAAAVAQFRDGANLALEQEMVATFAPQDLKQIKNSVALQMGSFASSRTDTLASVLLAGHTDVQFVPPAVQPDELKQGDRDQLYAQTSVPPAYRNAATMGPGILKGQIQQLFSVMKRTDAYKNAYSELSGAERRTAQAALATAVSQFETFFLHKVDFGGTTYGGLPMIVTALGYLETYVATLLHKERLGITDDSIAASFSALIAINTIDGGDTSARCATGFAGRVVTLTEALARGGNESLEHDLLQFRHECVQTAFDRANAGNSESSMAALQIPELKRAVGLAPQPSGAALPGNRLNGVNPNLAQQFYHAYNPVTVYQRALNFMNDRLRILLRDADGTGLQQLVDELTGSRGNADERRYDMFYEDHDPSQPWSASALKQLIDGRLIPLLLNLGMLQHNTSGAPLYLQSNAGGYGRTELMAGSSNRYRASGAGSEVERNAYSQGNRTGSATGTSGYRAAQVVSG